ncbi:alpha/beta fold hydrolase [Sphingoaurantiacus capsulatus]|uniref:Alpha/beta fold hydrolase n=1 Tax=Sphingoaurantiacus capsulatus TaxID=1771310 RepID=A0ABV7X8L0_9SPHN
MAADHSFASFDGERIAWRELGEGRPVVLIHGLFSHGEMNWLRWKTAQVVADAGFRVILPDLRAHGKSAAPHDAANYPADVLAQDIEALVAHLGLSDFDLGGYSLGARTTVRLLARGMRPRRAILAGMGLMGITGATLRSSFFLNAIANRDAVERGTPEYLAVQFMKSTGTDPEAVKHVLQVQSKTEGSALDDFDLPILVVCGADDQDNGSAPDLAAALLQGTYVEIPGNHMSAVTRPELGAAIRDFLLA